jgi:hypothetical protein
VLDSLGGYLIEFRGEVELKVRFISIFDTLNRDPYWHIIFFEIQSALVTTAFDIPAYSTNGENLVVTNLHSTNFA